MTTPTTTPARFSRKAAVRARFALSDPHLFRLIVAGIFPKPVYFGPRSPRWRNDDLDAFEARISVEGLCKPADASASTAAARAAYQARAESGELKADRQKTAAAKRAAGVPA